MTVNMDSVYTTMPMVAIIVVTGSMIVSQVMVPLLGPMVTLTKDNSPIIVSMEKANSSLQIVALIQATGSTIRK